MGLGPSKPAAVQRAPPVHRVVRRARRAPPDEVRQEPAKSLAGPKLKTKNSKNMIRVVKLDVAAAKAVPADAEIFTLQRDMKRTPWRLGAQTADDFIESQQPAASQKKGAPRFFNGEKMSVFWPVSPADPSQGFYVKVIKTTSPITLIKILRSIEKVSLMAVAYSGNRELVGKSVSEADVRRRLSAYCVSYLLLRRSGHQVYVALDRCR